MTNGKKLKTYLADNGLRNKWLQDATLIGSNTVSRWLNDKSIPQEKHAKKIEEITGGAVPADGWAR